ncbi:uncharacterized protein LOC125768802 isoform X1 [Anopheles funestus]|uniref:uncharacterized protein LOC125768802 isoform X1 n=1 Tax=Anopheles funestus TaxID=62324 RepID=UPI0020C5EEEC|nr:uncharacterized protein LOC125768802 isoform X1 [Anopheles funestus]
MCRNNSGSDAAFLELMESFQSATNCSFAAIDVEGFMSEAKTLSSETLTTFLSRYCPQLQAACNCTAKLMNNFRPCVDEDYFNKVLNFTSSLPDAVEQVCKNGGENLFEFDEPKYTESFGKISDSIDECLTFLNGSMTSDQCPHLYDFQMCLLDTLKVPKLFSMYYPFYLPLFPTTPCRNVINILLAQYKHPKSSFLFLLQFVDILKLELGLSTMFSLVKVLWNSDSFIHASI